MGKLSIVVPVYNAEKWIDDCAKSLLNQDLKNNNELQIIFVNDGSTDNSYSLLKDIKNNFDSNDNSSQISIVVTSQENKGHAAARNTGMDLACGDYVWFVDSDDFIDQNCVNSIIDCMDREQLDSLTVHPQNVDEFAKYSNYCFDKQFSILEKTIPEECGCSGVKIFNRSIITSNNIRWDDRLSPCDDFAFLFFTQIESKKMAYSPEINYYVRVRSNSVSRNRSAESVKRSRESFVLLTEIFNDELKKDKYSPQQRENILARRDLCTQTVLLSAASHLSAQDRNSLLKRLKSEGLYPYKFITWQLKPKISVKRTVMDWMLFFFPVEILYRMLCPIIKRIRK